MASVLIILGSKSDAESGRKALDVLKRFGVEAEMIVASAHRTPDRVRLMVEKSKADVFIAIAGLAAALPGAVASFTSRPVIGVPVSGKLGLDSILSIVQMPPGIPVACVGLDRGDNAALLAVSMLSIGDDKLAKALSSYRREMADKVESDSNEVQPLMFDPQEFVKEKIEELKTKITGKAIIACSGGVDSTVAAVLVDRAIGDRLLTVYVDTGLMRKETEDVRRMFDNLNVHYRIVDAQEEFFAALKGKTDPEAKRKAIGEKFIRVFEREAKAFGADHLVQGTIAPDWIESGDGVRDTIKSHHNVGGLPKDMTLKLVEPLWDLYKDEVRSVARFLGVEVSERQPFPGPALAIRVIGEANPESISVVRKACAIVEEELETAAAKGSMVRPWQYFAVLLPVQSVGVQGDRRAYGRTIAIRSVESVDAMTASFSKIPYDVLERISLRLTNEMKANVNRVVYDVTHKPPATIEWE